MAVLEQIRTKAGWLILVIISIALLSFIIDPTSLQSVSNMFSSKNDVGEMNGNAISAMEYQQKVEYYTQIDQIIYQTQSEELTENAKQNAWFSFINKNIFEKEYNKIGLGVSDAELVDLANGNNLSPFVANLFTDPNTGQINWEGLDNFWRNPDNNPDIQRVITYLEVEIVKNREMSKYSNLINKSEYINSLQLKRGVDERSTNVEFDYILQSYPQVKDSTITVSESEVKKYYNENKKHYEQSESRDVEYVAFPILPSEEDFVAAKEKMEAIATEFAETTEPRQYAIANSDVAPSTKYYKQDELDSELGEFAFSAGRNDVLPVYLDNYSYKTARISDIKNLPDSVRARHILIKYEQTQESYDGAKHKADSLYNMIKANPSLFPVLALTNGTDGTAQSGGDIGWFRDGKMVQPFNDSCFFSPVNKVMLLETQFGFHIVQVTERGREIKKVQLATIEREVSPSKITLNSIYSTANDVILASGKDYNKFIAYLQEKGIELQKEYQVQRAATRFGSHNEVRELIRWIYDADVNIVSEVLEVDNRQQLVIVAVTKIREDGFSPIEDEKAGIVAKLKLEKEHQAEAEKVKQALAGVATIDDIAAKLGVDVQQSLEGTNFGSNYISGLGVEPLLAAAVSGSDENKLYGPVVGDLGVYVYVVTAKRADEGYTEDLEKSRLQRLAASKSFGNVLVKAAKLKDVRAKFF
jgi:peptidyl-prolyl cis-trans isomerase D